MHGFDPQALTSLTSDSPFVLGGTFGFDPQALTSLTDCGTESTGSTDGFDPQALTSLTAWMIGLTFSGSGFRSTGSYEPDPRRSRRRHWRRPVSIHRLLRA